MREILKKVSDIANGNKKEKNKLVLDYMSSDLAFNKFMKYCLDASLTFNVSRVAMTAPTTGDFYTKLDELNLKGSASKLDKEELAALGSQSPAHLEVLNKILRKNPDCGFSAKSLHAILPGEIPYFPYQRCSTDSAMAKIFAESDYAYSELKENGMFIRVKFASRPIYETRNGKRLDFLGVTDRHFEKLAGATYGLYSDGYVFEGEGLVVSEDGVNYLPRTLGNAIINKFQGGYGTKEEAERIRFSFWNVLPLDQYTDGYSPLAVKTRRLSVQSLIEFLKSPVIKATESIVVHSIDEAWAHYHEIRSRPVPEGEEPFEGNIVKHPGEVWKDGTSGLMAKGKAVKECEVLITGWEYGKPGGKNEHRLGSFHIESSCGMLKGKCSGMSDTVRDEDPDSHVGKIATVKFNAVSKSEDTSKPRSFDHARFIEFRPDKSKADDLGYILKVKSKKR